MNRINIKRHSLTLLLLAITSTVYAKDERVEHDAHEHGVAEMNIVWDKADLNIELLSPAFNITGFEFQPANHEQEEAIAKIEKKLNLPNELFAFSGSSCKAVKTEVESPFEDHDDEHKDEHDEHKNHEEHAKHDDDHKNEHDDHKDDHDDHKNDEEHAKHKDDHDKHKDEHDEHKDHAEHESSTHSEYSISYEFTCENNEAELSIAADKLFKHFPKMEKIKVQWLSATQQSSAILTKTSNTIILK